MKHILIHYKYFDCRNADICLPAKFKLNHEFYLHYFVCGGCCCCTLTDMTSRCPASLLKTTPPPPRYPWVSRGRHGPSLAKCRGLVLDHQVFKGQESKNVSKLTKFKQKCLFLGGFGALSPLYFDGRAPNP